MKWTAYPVKDAIKITEIFSFFKMHYNDTYEFSGETHNFWECMYVIDGSLCVSADEKVYNLSEGEIIFHKPLELHKFHITDPAGATVMVFAYSAEGTMCSFFNNKVFLLDPSQNNILSELLDYAESHADDKDHSYKRYITAFDNMDMYSQSICLHMQRLMLSLAEKSSTLPVSKATDSVIFTKAVKYMNDRICESPSIEEVSAYVSMSVSSIKRIFNRYAGMGVHKYFLKLKLKAAIELLNQGYTVTYVSEKLNFSSQGYFSKVFKRETGLLPSSVNKRQ